MHLKSQNKSLKMSKYAKMLTEKTSIFKAALCRRVLRTKKSDFWPSQLLIEQPYMDFEKEFKFVDNSTIN